MKRILAKCLAAALMILCCFSLSACEELAFADIQLVGEPTWTVMQEEDGEYTAIVEGYAKNYSNKAAYRSEATVDYFDINGEKIEENKFFYSDIDRIDIGETWHFYIKTENLPTAPASIKVFVYEDM